MEFGWLKFHGFRLKFRVLEDDEEDLEQNGGL